MTFLDVELSKEEEFFITSVVVKMANGQSISEADVLHKILQMAQSDNKLEIAKRELRKLKHVNKQNVAYDEALELLSS